MEKIWLLKKGSTPFLLGRVNEFSDDVSKTVMALMSLKSGFTHYVISGEAPVNMEVIYGQV